MRSIKVNSFAFSGVSFVQYFLLAAKVSHSLIIALPGILITYINGELNSESLFAIFIFVFVSVLILDRKSVV